MSPERPTGLLVGIEVHQQLDTPSKLFCSCPPSKSEELPYSFERRLRPAQSELGRLDPAAVFEYSKGKSNLYLWSPESSCLVEADEEPPHQMAPEALEAGLVAALALRARVVDELHVMRKIVIDGSNTTGFQRTAVVGIGGSFDVDGKRVGVQSVTLEEDAARILGEDGTKRMFALDRLGIPLVEVALDPVSGGPVFAGKVALYLGRLLRSTGRVARGLGTIRQDLNVSLKGGAVVEVKGVQKLNLVSKVVDYEARRQEGLIMVAEKLRAQGVSKVECSVSDVTSVFKTSSAGAFRSRLPAKGVVSCIVAKSLGGLLGWEAFPGIRLGREVAEVARANGLGGITHSDEFEKAGVTLAEETALRSRTSARKSDALILVAGSYEDVQRVVPMLVARLSAAPGGVPAETRAATDEGQTKYMRPRPGSQRMYPETDIPNLTITPKFAGRLASALPRGWEETVKNLREVYSLSADLALKLFDSGQAEEFLNLAKSHRLEPSLIASVLVDLPVRLAREGVPESVLTPESLAAILGEVEKGRIAKEAIPDLLKAMGERGLSIQEAYVQLGIRTIGRDELRRVVESVVRKNKRLVVERGGEAFSALMGEAMKELRGRADGAAVSEALREELSKARKSSEG